MTAVRVDPLGWQTLDGGVLDHIARAGLESEILELVQIAFLDFSAVVERSAIDQDARCREEDISFDDDRFNAI